MQAVTPEEFDVDVERIANAHRWVHLMGYVPERPCGVCDEIDRLRSALLRAEAERDEAKADALYAWREKKVAEAALLRAEEGMATVYDEAAEDGT